MPSFPPPGAVTICEINRDLVAADALSDDRAKDAYGDVLGMVFSPIPFQLEALLINREPPAADQAEPAAESAPAGRLASTVSEFFKRMIFPPLDPNLLEQFDTQKVSWNPHKHCLAFVSGKNQLTVNDFEDLDGKEPCILTSDHQADVKAVEWRPNSGKMIAVGCKGGICLWSASYPGNVPFVKSGVTSSFSTFPRGSGRQWILVDVLRGSSDELVSALCWKPDGRYLASASCNSPSFTIWDVSQGLGTPIRRGLSSISLVRWSPSGDYLLVAKLYSQFHFPFYISRYQYFQRFTKFIFYNDGTFHFWETNTWTSVPWSSSNGYVSGAKWDPEGCVVLLSFSNSTTLGSIHFSSKPPSLDAHLLPVELPEISSLIVSRGIEKLACDASGERLALSFKDGNEMYRGLVAVYDVRRSPLVSLSLVGFIRGPGEGAKPLAFAFHNKLTQGPLLSVCWSSGWCCTYPLILRSH